MAHTSQNFDAIHAAARKLIADELICEKKLASRWNCSVKMLQKARLAGTHLPFRKIGKSMVRYAMSDILEYEDRQTRTSTSDEGAIDG